MPWATSAPTVASAVVICTAMSAGDGVECFDLRMTLENQAAECADRGRAVETTAGVIMRRRRARTGFEPVAGAGRLRTGRGGRTRIEDGYDAECHHWRHPSRPRGDRRRFARVCQDRKPPTRRYRRTQRAP